MCRLCLGRINGSANMAFQSYLSPNMVKELLGKYQISEETTKGCVFNSYNKKKH